MADVVAGALPDWSRKYINLGSMDIDAREGALDGFRRMQNAWSASKGWEGAKKDLEQVQNLRLQLRKLERLHVLASQKNEVDVKLSVEIKKSLSEVSTACGQLSDGALRRLYRDSSLDAKMVHDLGQNSEFAKNIAKIDPYKQPAAKAAAVYERSVQQLSALGRVVDDDRNLTRLKIYAGKESSREELKKHWKERPGKSWAAFRGSISKALTPQGQSTDEMDMALNFLGGLGQASEGTVSSIVVYGKALHRSTTNPMLQWTKYGMSSCIAFAFDREARAKMNEQMGRAMRTGLMGQAMDGMGAIHKVHDDFKPSPQDLQAEKISKEEFRDKCRRMADSVGGLPNSVQKNLKGEWRVLKDTGKMGEAWKTAMDYQSGMGYGVFSSVDDLEKRKNLTGYLYGVIDLDALGYQHLRKHNEQFGNTEIASRDLADFLEHGEFKGDLDNFERVVRNMDVSGSKGIAAVQGDLQQLAAGNLKDAGIFKNNNDAKKVAMEEMAKVINKDFSTVLDLATVASTRARVMDLSVKNCTKSYRKDFVKLRSQATARQNKDFKRAMSRDSNAVPPRNNMLDHLATPGMVAAIAFCDAIAERSSNQEGEYSPADVLAQTFNAQSDENRKVLAEQMGLEAGDFVQSKDENAPKFLVDVSKQDHLEILSSMSYGIKNHSEYLRDAASGGADPALRDLGTSLQETHASNIHKAHWMQYGPQEEADAGEMRDGEATAPDPSQEQEMNFAGGASEEMDLQGQGELDRLGEFAEQPPVGPELVHALSSDPVPDSGTGIDDEARDYSGLDEPNLDGSPEVQEQISQDIQDAKEDVQSVRDEVSRDTQDVQQEDPEMDLDPSRIRETDPVEKREDSEAARKARDSAWAPTEQVPIEPEDSIWAPTEDPAAKKEAEKRTGVVEEPLDAAFEKPIKPDGAAIPKPNVPDDVLRAMNDTSKRQDLGNQGGDSSIGLVAKKVKGSASGMEEGHGAESSTDKGKKPPVEGKKPKKPDSPSR